MDCCLTGCVAFGMVAAFSCMRFIATCSSALSPSNLLTYSAAPLDGGTAPDGKLFAFTARKNGCDPSGACAENSKLTLSTSTCNSWIIALSFMAGVWTDAFLAVSPSMKPA